MPLSKYPVTTSKSPWLGRMALFIHRVLSVKFDSPSVGRAGDRFTSEDVVYCTTPVGAREFG